MAILTLIAFGVISGSQNDARELTLDAERLMRLRGIAKRHISRKACLLHHIYTWIRIIGESTSVLHDYSAHTNFAEHLHPRTPAHAELGRLRKSQHGHNARLDDFLRLGPQHEDHDMELQKELDVGLADIHLSDPRQFPASMYLQINGLPETRLSLLSQTTRLANSMDV
jgi:arginine metabolism regulation protein II